MPSAFMGTLRFFQNGSGHEFSSYGAVNDTPPDANNAVILARLISVLEQHRLNADQNRKLLHTSLSTHQKQLSELQEIRDFLAAFSAVQKSLEYNLQTDMYRKGTETRFPFPQAEESEQQTDTNTK